MQQYRTLVYNLRDSKNTTLRFRVLKVNLNFQIFVFFLFWICVEIDIILATGATETCDLGDHDSGAACEQGALSISSET